jgi:hypothetical protein
LISLFIPRKTYERFRFATESSAELDAQKKRKGEKTWQAFSVRADSYLLTARLRERNAFGERQLKAVISASKIS